MKKLLFRQPAGILALFVLITTAFTSVPAQERGNFSFAAPPAEVILQKSKINASFTHPGSEIQPPVFSQRFVSAVGGISFGNTAVFDASFQVNTLHLSYNKEKSDGERVELHLNGNPVKIGIYDWILIPVAHFANSDYTSVFTYFGKLKNKQLEETILENDGHILNYHPDLQNTLLGWRLADMDMLIMYDFTTDLPKINGRYILGAGETPPDLKANHNGAYYFLELIKQTEQKLGYSFQSYVITDYSREITCSVLKDSLVISGFPYYYCWRSKSNEPGFNLNTLSSDIWKTYENTIKQKKSEGNDFDVRAYFIDSLIEISKRFEEGYDLYKSGTVNDLLKIESLEGRRTFLDRFDTESLRTMAVEVTAGMIANTPMYLKAFSDQISAEPEMIRAFNPAVWNATVATMRVSAFFRYVRENFPEEWTGFMVSITGAEPVPAVITPTVVFEKGNSILGN